MQEDILVVDDDQDIIDILSETLNRQGYHVEAAGSGEAAIRCYERKPPSLLVLDMMLPDMGGLEVLKRLRTLPWGRDVPVLVLSGSGDIDLKMNSYDSGVEDYLVKPIRLKEFNAKVKAILKRCSRSRALEEERDAMETGMTREHKNYLEINRQLKKQLLSMKTLFSVSQDLTRILDLDELLNAAALTVIGELQVSSMALFTLENENSRVFTVREVKGFNREKFEGIVLPMDSEFVKWVLKRHKPKKIARTRDKGWVRRLPDIRLAAFEYATPLLMKEELKGIVFTGPKISGDDYSLYDLDMLVFICNFASVGIENARLFRKLQSTYLSTVKTLISIIEAKDSYTKGHTERVAEYSVGIAEKMNLPKEDRRLIAFAAALHDIGKLGVLENVLNKEEELSEDEWEILKAHPEAGAKIIENMEFLAGTVDLVRHHHESYDGTGYPYGLKGDAIPLGARIIAVADSFDAMTTDRPYRKALPRSKVIRMLESGAGAQFDPEVVKHFINLLEDDEFIKRMGKKMRESRRRTLDALPGSV